MGLHEPQEVQWRQSPAQGIQKPCEPLQAEGQLTKQQNLVVLVDDRLNINK